MHTDLQQLELDLNALKRMLAQGDITQEQHDALKAYTIGCRTVPAISERALKLPDSPGHEVRVYWKGKDE